MVWIRAAAVLAVCGVLVAAWAWSPATAATFDRLASWLAPHRQAWYALPLVMLAFVTLGLVMVPVLLLVAVTGVVFGPVLGPLYALAGSLASASVGFVIGRWIGLRRVEELGGERVTRLARAVKRNGTLAVFLVRKVPAPFTLANIVVGASTVRYRDFLVGTVLGMGFFVIALAGFGYQMSRAWHDPSPETLFATLMLLAIPLMLAWLINRALREKAAG